MDAAIKRTRQANQPYNRLYDRDPNFNPNMAVKFRCGAPCADAAGLANQYWVEEGTTGVVQYTHVTDAGTPTEHRTYSVIVMVSGTPVIHKDVKEEWLVKA